MSKPFNMELFLVRVLTGSYATRQRYLRQAMAIQAAIAGNRTIHGPGSENISSGFWIIA